LVLLSCDTKIVSLYTWVIMFMLTFRFY
jgi:hypothetical protein